MNNRAIPLLISAVIITAGAAPGPARAGKIKGSFRRVLEVPESKTASLTLIVRTGNGKVRVEPGDVDKVEIRAKILAKKGWLDESAALRRVRALEENPPIIWKKDRIDVGRIKDEDLKKNVRIDYHILVPADMRVEARAGNGRVTLLGLSGPLEAHTGNGSVLIEEPGAELEASTGNGAIKVVGKPWERWKLSSGNGKIRLLIPKKTSFTLDVATGNGAIETDHPVAVTGKLARNRLKGDVRGGGPVIKIRTGNGAVEIAATRSSR